MSIRSPSLHLNGCVEHLVLLALADPIHVPDGFVPEVRPYVAGKYILATRQLPAMEVVDLFDSLKT